MMIALRDVWFRYHPRAPWLLRGVTLDIAHGEAVGIIGANGCGKSTLTRLLVGLLRPERGSIRIADITPDGHHHLPTVGLIGDPGYLDGAFALPSELPVHLLLDTYHTLFARSGGASDARLRAMLQLDAADLQRCRIDTLSRGQRQRLLLYLALAKRPHWLIGDEATEGLDRAAQPFIMQQVAEHHQRGAGVLWVSHRHDEVAQLCQRIYELREGELHRIDGGQFRCRLTHDDAPELHGTFPLVSVLRTISERLLEPTTRRFTCTVERDDEPTA